MRLSPRARAAPGCPPTGTGDTSARNALNPSRRGADPTGSVQVAEELAGPVLEHAVQPLPRGKRERPFDLGPGLLLAVHLDVRAGQLEVRRHVPRTQPHGAPQE